VLLKQDWFLNNVHSDRLVDKRREAGRKEFVNPEDGPVGRVMARLYDRMMKGTEEACLRQWRRQLIAPIRGQVLEVGAGTGVTLPLYGHGVDRIVMSEPDRHMRSQLTRKIRSAGADSVEVSDGSLVSLPFPDETFDYVTCMLVLCSVPDLDHALAEIRRVLSAQGRLVFMEHVAAEGRPRRLTWQRRIEPFWKRISGNCHLTRRTEAAILDAGFRMETIQRDSIRKASPIVRPSIRGVAVRA
jgi:SAM-dependent methyltransferase